MIVVNFYVSPEFACPEKKFSKLVRAICKRFNLAGATVDIAIVDDGRMRELNSRFLNRKASTDCLAFDLSQPDNGHRFFELVLNGQKAKSESAKRGHSPQAEMALYVTHGLLHNLGLDDRLAKGAQKMHRLEDEILRQQGFGPVYHKAARSLRRKPRAKRKSAGRAG